MWPFSPAGPTADSSISEPPPPQDIATSDPASENLPRQIRNPIPSSAFETSASRLSIPFPLRLTLSTFFGLAAGFSLGAGKGATNAGLRYRAENAHRLPTTRSGWYHYHKTKNYHSIVGGVKEGVWLGARLSIWAALFVSAEEGVDRLRGKWNGDINGETRHGDVASTVCAGLGTAGFYTWTKGHDVFTAARVTKTALKYSFIYGFSQDLLSTLRGKPPAYIQWVSRQLLGRRETIPG